MKLVDSLNPATQAENIKKLNAGLEAVDAKTPKDYSTTETATGQKWIDGKDIYCKVFSGITSSETGNETIGTIPNVNFVKAFIMLQNTSGTWVIGSITLLVSSSTGNIVISKGGTTSYIETPYIIYVYYTKNPAPGRSPEDQEPEEPEKKTTKKKTTK